VPDLGLNIQTILDMGSKGVEGLVHEKTSKHDCSINNMASFTSNSLTLHKVI